MSDGPAGSDVVGRDAWVSDGFGPVPGDVVALPGGDAVPAATVYLCAETADRAATRWTWVVLADGRLLEVAPRGCALYGPAVLLGRGGGEYLALVAQDGALVRFEERVRAGVWEARPVRLNLEQRRWRVTSTGTVVARRLGPVPTNGWRQLGARAAAAAAGDLGVAAPPVPPIPPGLGESLAAPGRVRLPPDVYFTLAETGPGDGQGIGLWATDICLAFGRRLGDSPAAAGLRVLGG